MKIIDISWPLSETMTGYKNKKEFSAQKVRSLPQDSSEESIFTIGSHAGTHIDAPAHMIVGGIKTSSIALDSIIGQAYIIDMIHISEVITGSDLVHYFEQNAHTIEGKIVLFKTRNSLLEPTALFDPTFISIAYDAATYLVSKKIKAVGIDYLGVERNQKNHETHTLFMNSGITIIEGLRLREAAEKEYFCVCLPLALSADGAPARAVLFDKNPL